MFSNLTKTLSSFTLPTANDIVVAQRQLSTTLLTIVPESEFKNLAAKAASAYCTAATLVADQIDHATETVTASFKETTATVFSEAKV